MLIFKRQNHHNKKTKDIVDSLVNKMRYFSDRPIIIQKPVKECKMKFIICIKTHEAMATLNADKEMKLKKKLII